MFPLDPHIQTARDDLTDTLGYLGDANTADDFEWFRCGSERRLIAKEEVAAWRQKKADPQNRGVKIPYPEPTLLSAIVFIPTKHCWMVLCGYWKGPTQSANSFVDVKLTCVGDAVNHPTLRADFGTFIANVGQLIQRAASNGCDSQVGILVPDEHDRDYLVIKFRHKLFKDICKSKAVNETGRPFPLSRSCFLV